ncbi:MAG: hypothetical protein ACRD0C_14700, partial [Acidimicrobiia bacterium]
PTPEAAARTSLPLPPMAPRVVVRQTVTAAPAAHAGGSTGSSVSPGVVQRATWTSAPDVGSGPAATGSGAVTPSPVHVMRQPDGRHGAAAVTTGPDTAIPGRMSSSPAERAAPGVDMDRLIEAIEERVLAEIERRGGRYTGLF